MYKLIIVDDEEEVRKGIIRKINWASFNFDTPGEAENGREALDLIEENIPDVIITDITMPLMDGLKLSSIINDSYPTIKTVILTGFDDFEFAQRAIRYGVTDYLLKPVLPQDIDELMGKLKKRIDDEIARKEDVIKLRSHYIESLPIIRDKFLTLLITGKPSQAEINRRVQLHNLRLGGNGFVVAVANIDINNFSASDSDDDDAELCKFAVLNITREIVEKYSLGEAFFHDENLVVIAGYKDNDKKTILNKTISTLEEIRYHVEKYLKVTISIGLGSICDSLGKIRDSYKNALTALEYKLLIGSSRVIYIEDLEPQTADNVVFDDNKEQILISSLKFGSGKDVSQAVQVIFNEIVNTKASLKDYQLYFLEIVAAISRLSRVFQLDIGEMLGQNLNAELFKFNTMHEIKDWMESICIKLNHAISSKMQNKAKILLEKAKDYIQRNYADDTLSLQKLADHLHISVCYLSLIFKKEAEETFLKYLVRVRLDAAKDLLSNSELQTAEIAEKIGYPDINYFSFFFKKNIGISPREYRNRLIGKNEV